VTVVLFAFGSSSVPELVRVGSQGRWLALAALGIVAVARSSAPRALPVAWLIAAAFVALAVTSGLWSVDPRLTVGRGVSVGLLFVTACALALGARDARSAATAALLGVLRGMALVALISLLVLAFAHDNAVLPATAGAGWRFRGVGLNPNTVAMLLAIGLPLAVWRAFERARSARWEGIVLMALFVGELAFSASRGALLAGFCGAAVTAAVLAATRARKVAAVAALVALAIVSFEVANLPNPAPLVAAPVSTAKPPPPTVGVDAEHVFRLEDELGFPLGGAYRPPVPRTLLGSSGRAQAWDGAIRQGARRPIAGYGFGTENHTFVDRFFAFQSGFVENTYIGLFLQLGVVGVIVFLALLGALAWSGVRAVRLHGGPAAAALGVLAAALLIGITQSGLLSAGNIAASSIWVSVLTLPLLAREAHA
jgi:O-antigen ligase